MVIGAPRSGTSWAANWLTTEHSLCIHDPLFTRRYDELDALAQTVDRPLGVSCTGLWAFSDFVNAHPARKVVLHRPVDEINASLRRIGLPEVEDVEDKLNAILGDGVVHCVWSQLFHSGTASLISEHLGFPFDARRHEFLRELEMGPRYQALVPDTSRIRKMLDELKEPPRTSSKFERCCDGICDGACTR